MKEKIQDELGIACGYETLLVPFHDGVQFDGVQFDDDRLVSSYFGPQSYFGQQMSPIVYLKFSRPSRAACFVVDVTLNNDDKELKLEFETNATIKSVKEKVEQETGIPIKDQRLLNPLQDDICLSHCAKEIYSRTSTPAATTKNNLNLTKSEEEAASTTIDHINDNLGAYILVLLILNGIIASYVILTVVLPAVLSVLFGLLWIFFS